MKVDEMREEGESENTDTGRVREIAGIEQSPVTLT